MALFSFLRRSGLAPRSSPGSPTYEIVCFCGARLTGTRIRTSQIARCARCGRDSYVLAQSPLPELTLEELPTQAEPLPPKPASRLRWLLMGSGILAAALAVALLFLLRPGSQEPPARSAANLWEQRQRRGQMALAEGNFQVATAELHAALQLAQSRSSRLSPEEFRQLSQLSRQAALLADLLHEPLAVLLQLAAGVPDQEWQAVFARHYAGKSVVFDTVVRRTADGQYEMEYVIREGPTHGKLHLEDVALLRKLPLEQPTRLLFGVRLAGVYREQNGWRIRLQPESGVLLTDPAAVEACLPLVDEEAMRDVLANQSKWLQEMQ